MSLRIFSGTPPRNRTCRRPARFGASAAVLSLLVGVVTVVTPHGAFAAAKVPSAEKVSAYAASNSIQAFHPLPARQNKGAALPIGAHLAPAGPLVSETIVPTRSHSSSSRTTSFPSAQFPAQECCGGGNDWRPADQHCGQYGLRR